MNRAALLSALLLAACSSLPNAGGGRQFDRDGDGYAPAAGDCRDDDAGIHPGATDLPYDGID
jgi:hypothetical protein